MKQYSKAIAAAIPLAILVLNQLLPLTSGNTKAYINLALAALAVVSVILSPRNADPEPAQPMKTALK